MAKKLIPSKIVIEFVDGKFTNGVILYKVNDNGALSKIKSIGIKNADFSKPVLNGLMEKFIKHAKKSEGFPDDLP
ncbi:hypothetical protein KKF63_13775 [bacterium]|nr:hypothetical protein [bacterium]